MRKFLQKFDEMYKGKKYIEIEFLNDNPLTTKYIRHNQSGKVCYCIEGNTTGSQKTKNGWKPIECNEQCQYRQKDDEGKSACNRIGWLKFFIPTISKDRMWLMRITSQTSINRIDAYINLQKSKGNSLNGRYILFLKQEEQTSKFTGQKFNNYLLDILQKEDFILTQEAEQTNKLSTTNPQNVDNNVVNEEKTTNIPQAVTTNAQSKDTKTKENTSKKSTSKKESANKTKKAEIKKETQTNTTESTSNEYENYYVLDSTFKETIENKKGETKEYLIGKFYDMQDKVCNIVIKPEYENELMECDLGTIVELEIKDIAERKFAMNLKFIDKHIKKVVA